MQNSGTDALPVAVDIDPETGRWDVDGLPMVLVPQHLLVNNLDAVERHVGRETASEWFRSAGRRSAHHWCAHEAERLGVSGAAIVRHYLDRLTRRGWGRFEIDELDTERGVLRVRVTHSALLPVAGAVRSADRACYLFEAWLEGALAFASADSLDASVREVQCAGSGNECVFASN